MKQSHAILALGSLAQETRLRTFRLLVRKEPEGLTAGELARALKVPAPTLSFHLKELENAKLITSTRSGRLITYRVALAGVRALVDYLLRDCCQGRPELCDVLLPASCCEAPAAPGSSGR